MSVAGCNCKKTPPKPTLLTEGSPCQSDDQCETGLCDGVAVVSTPKCVRKCTSTCLDGEVCTQLTPNRFSCQPDTRRLCQACTGDTDCAYPSDKCLVVNGEHVCGRDCAFDQNCPEGYRCLNGLGVDGESKLQQCVPTNASCACLARGDFMQPCEVTNTYGTCGGIKTCDLINNVVACDAPTPVADVCNGKDDNCDGKIDEDGGVQTCGVGACLRTVTACANGMAATCTPGDAGPELCDGIDNDCDGVKDNGFPVDSDVNNCGACLNVCNLPHAVEKCDMRVCKVDTCDPGYDNCNLMDPDGCESEKATDVRNCGGCGNICSSANATPSCVGGMCRFMCMAGFIDLDMDPANGCEYQCTFMSATDLPDVNFVDANCDGIDGELTKGIFVSPSGDDVNNGLTRALPKKTIAAGLSAMSTNGKRDLYVAAGVYPEPIELLGTSDVNVAGQYDPTTWRRAATNVTNLTAGNPGIKIDAAANVLVQGFKVNASDGDAAKPNAYGVWVTESQTVKLEKLDVTAGRGADGAPGSAGTAGTPGGSGAPGAEGCVQETRGGIGSNEQTACLLYFNIFDDAWCSSRPTAGAGGTSACGFPGGPGGQPSHFDFDIAPTPAGDNGSPAPSGSGIAGQGAPFGATPQPGSVYFGQDGTNGTSGTNGAGATASSAFTSAGFTRANGLNGSAGLPGKGAGGGGGGAGGRSSIIADPVGTCEAWGSAGGGGGGGGCGGTQGFGGVGGGASVGLFMFNAQVSGLQLSVRSGNGGTGGHGGDGGGPGLGGSPGVSSNPNNNGQATKGGNGGRGGSGGTGGHGGGGAGGSTFGLARNAGSTWTPVMSTSFNTGTAGAGGTSLGNAGAAGVAQLQLTF